MSRRSRQNDTQWEKHKYNLRIYGCLVPNYRANSTTHTNNYTLDIYRTHAASSQPRDHPSTPSQAQPPGYIIHHNAVEKPRASIHSVHNDFCMGAYWHHPPSAARGLVIIDLPCSSSLWEFEASLGELKIDTYNKLAVLPLEFLWDVPYWSKREKLYQTWFPKFRRTLPKLDFLVYCMHRCNVCAVRVLVSNYTLFFGELAVTALLACFIMFVVLVSV